MKRLIPALLVLCFVYASPAFALFSAEYDDAPPAENCGAIDSTKPCYFSISGGYFACSARGTQRCRNCAALTRTSNEVCVYIAESGYCNCSDRKQTDGSTACWASGSCTFIFN